MKANKIALFIIITALLTVSVVSTVGWANEKREHERVLRRYDSEITEVCRTALTAIEDYKKDGSDAAYGWLTASVGAMQALIHSKYYFDKDGLVIMNFECHECRQNLIKYKEDSVKHLDLLSEALRFYIDGNTDTFTWRLQSFNANVEQERTGK